MVDYAEVTLLTASAFFAALSVGLLYRYRQVSREINKSSDLGHDLWASLEGRLKKQDERLLDVMARLDVVQTRVLFTPAVQAQVQPNPTVRGPPQPAKPVTDIEEMSQEDELRHVAQHPELQESQQVQPQPEPSTPEVAGSPERELPSSVPTPAEGPLIKLDSTCKVAIAALTNKPLSTIEISKVLKEKADVQSREQAARVMKFLFDRGLVSRDESDRPFVYSLTDEGRRYLS